MVHASLFSGIGGFEIAAAYIGWENAFHCEINEWCGKILKYYFPNSEHYEDIAKTDFSKWKGKVDILTGGFPCQPFSLAGRRKGADDDRYLWPQFIRVIREVRPAWVVGENVAGILTMVQPGETAKLGCSPSLFGDGYEEEETRQQYVVETISSDLEQEGYSVQPFVIPACAVGAPHRRDRVFFVAHRSDAGIEDMQQGGKDGVLSERHVADTDGKRCNDRIHNREERQVRYEQERNAEEDQPERGKRKCRTCENGQDASNSESQQSERCKSEQRNACQQKQGKFGRIGCQDGDGTWSKNFWSDFPATEPAIRRGDDGISGMLDGITFSQWRQESIKAYGNAIVPQVAYEIFKAIERITNL